MSLHIESAEYGRATFPKVDEWEIARLPGSSSTRLSVMDISVAPHGKHSLAMCSTFESEWRRVAARMLALLRIEPRVCFVWAQGPMEWDGLPRVFPYMVGGDDARNRYHVERVTSTTTEHYLCSWIVFEFNEDSFSEMMRDESLDLEFTALRALVFPDQYIERVISKPFESIGLAWLLEHDAMAVSPHSHFEGFYLVGDNSLIEEAGRRIREAYGL